VLLINTLILSDFTHEVNGHFVPFSAIYAQVQKTRYTAILAWYTENRRGLYGFPCQK
jgi:hypothetical protein